MSENKGQSQEPKRINVRNFAFLDYSDLNSKVFEVYSSFRADFTKALTQKQIVELKAINGKEISLDMITLASQIFNAEIKKVGTNKQIYIIPLEKEDNKYIKTDNKSVEPNGKKQKFTCFEIEALTEEQASIAVEKLPSKLQKRVVKGKAQAEPKDSTAEPSADTPTTPSPTDAAGPSDDLLFEISDLICARFKIDNQMRTKIESELANLLERYIVQRKEQKK